MASLFHGTLFRSTVFRRVLARAIVLAGLVAAGSPLKAQALAAPGAQELGIPGGIARLAGIVEVDPGTPRALFLLQVIRRVHDAPWGASENASRLLPPVLAHLDRVERPRDAIVDYVPLPLGPRFWSEVVFRGSVDADHLLRALLADRRASFLYHGLQALDAPTLSFLASNPGLVQEIHARAAHTFATTARSLGVENGVARVPGGDTLRKSWELLVGRPSTSAAQFVGELVGRDNGRLAFFFDTLSELDEPRLRFAARGQAGGTGSLHGLYEVFRKADPGWQIRHRPFARMAFDTATLLMAVQVTADGQFAGPGGLRLWDAVLSSDGNARSSLSASDEVGASSAVDAVWLASRVAKAPPDMRQQLVETITFGQRVFGDATDRDLPDVLEALGGVRRYPMLGLTLERMGIRAPALHARMARVASRLADFDGSDEARSPLMELQASLALVERLVFRRVLDTVVAEDLVAQLATRFESWPSSRQGVVAGWLMDDFFPRLGRAGGADHAREAIIIRALAGPATGADEATRVVRWEGTAYRVALDETLFERLEQIRQRQGRNLDKALAVVDDARMATVGNVVEGVRASVERLRTTIGETEGSPEIGELSVRVASLREGDDKRASALVERLARFGDRMLAESLASLVYAAALAEATQWLPDARDLDLRHDHGGPGATRAERARASWELPVEVSGPDVRWHFAGSLLGIDLGLAPLRLRRISNEPPLQAPKLNENDRRTFVQSVALLNPARLTDGDRDRIAAALKLGRARVQALAHQPGNVKAAAADAGLGAWRTRAAEWTIAHEPGRLGEIWSTRELLALGADGDRRRFDEWGLSAYPIDGSLRTRLSAVAPWESIAGRPMTGQLAAFVPDLNLRTAEVLADHGLPAELAPSVLAAAVQSLVDEVQPAYMDDWQSLVTYVRNLPGARFDDYISLLTADGPLVPALEAVHSESR